MPPIKRIARPDAHLCAPGRALQARIGEIVSLGARIREERQRLGMNQTVFAALAGASRRAMVSWEKNESAPLTTALMAWAEAGADALYMLTGHRTADRPDNPVTQIADQLAGIRRDVLDASRSRFPSESEEQTDARVLGRHINSLRAMLLYDAALMTADQREEVEALLEIITTPLQLASYRAADYAQNRARRREFRQRIAGWFDRPPYGEAVANLLTTLAMDYSVPVKLLVELVGELHDDIVREGEGLKPQR